VRKTAPGDIVPDELRTDHLQGDLVSIRSHSSVDHPGRAFSERLRQPVRADVLRRDLLDPNAVHPLLPGLSPAEQNGDPAEEEEHEGGQDGEGLACADREERKAVLVVRPRGRV
jgi:hypothetical protein